MQGGKAIKFVFALSIAAVLSLSLVDVGVATASRTHAKVNIYEKGATCATQSPEAHVLGTVSYKRQFISGVEDPVTVKVKLKDGAPEAPYEVWILNQECEVETNEIAFTTNSKGVGKATATFNAVESDTGFYAFVDLVGSGIFQGNTSFASVPLP